MFDYLYGAAKSASGYVSLETAINIGTVALLAVSVISTVISAFNPPPNVYILIDSSED